MLVSLILNSKRNFKKVALCTKITVGFFSVSSHEHESHCLHSMTKKLVGSESSTKHRAELVIDPWKHLGRILRLY